MILLQFIVYHSQRMFDVVVVVVHDVADTLDENVESKGIVRGLCCCSIWCCCGCIICWICLVVCCSRCETEEEDEEEDDDDKESVA